MRGGVLLLLAVMALSAWGGESQRWPLKQVFGANNVGMVQTSRQAIVEHCPDDTCLRFILEGRDALPVLHDFAFLYLALVENYDVENIKGPDGQRYFAAILARRKGTCTGPDEAALARCVLATLVERHPIQGYISKMDEGWRRTTPFDVKAALARAGIR
ncbi:hypothetical protein [Thiobacter aerophilum]|uniref:Rap1a immunity protein domain-containing protein n=1 Tax=Thiobacter aerophilum TaxID=3121275 RepID=A0ABV0EBK5_9BURK